MQEAYRIESENVARLFTEKRLSLILDLDQTIIHATVDPTVGEWMRDPDNPNFPALTVKTVKPFCFFFSNAQLLICYPPISIRTCINLFCLIVQLYIM
jgi:TFIIF-interacting CTD phosphatase-like protein